MSQNMNVGLHGNFDHLKAVLEENYAFNIVKFKKFTSYEDESYSIVVENENKVKEKYVSKIFNERDSTTNGLLPAIFNIQISLQKCDILKDIIPTPIATRNGNLLIKQENNHAIAVCSYLEGETLLSASKTIDHETYFKTLKKVGYYSGVLISELQKLPPPDALKRDKFEFDTACIGLMKDKLHVCDEPLKKICQDVIMKTEAVIDGVAKQPVKKGIIHSDLNTTNILVKHGGDGELCVSGIIDFNDCHVGFYAFEIGATLMQVMSNVQNTQKEIHLFDAAKIVLKEILQFIELTEYECELTYYGMLARCVILIIQLKIDIVAHPGIEEHCGDDIRLAQEVLEFLLQFSKNEVLKVLFQ